MAQWQTADAKQQFTRVVEAAEKGPQVIMRHKEPVAVMLSAAEYRALKRQADASFAALLLRTPLSPEDVAAVGLSLGTAEDPAATKAEARLSAE